MQRLVIALTTLLTLTGAAVVTGYLLVFAVGSDRLAQATPAGTAAYATVYLQPSTGQKMNLAQLLGRVPGFADAASLDQKIHEITARLMGEAGVDYERDVRPWLGNQVAIAARPDAADPLAADTWFLAATTDAGAAEAALERIATDQGSQVTTSEHEGVTVSAADGTAWAVLDELVIFAPDPASVTEALDVAAGRADSLASEAGFRDAMGRLPSDHLAAVYLDSTEALASSEADTPATGYTDLSLALVAEAEGLHLFGVAPFDADEAPESMVDAFELGRQVGELTGWMPEDTQAALVVFGLSQSLTAAEEQLGSAPGGDAVADALNQVRAVAALGLGIDIDDDVLPLFDGETAIAVGGIDTGTPGAQLLLRPSDAQAAEAALGRLRDALAGRGAAVDEEQIDGTTVTTVEVPELGTVSYAVRDGVVAAGLTTDAVIGALDAGAGTSLADTERYADAWELAGTRGGNEGYLDVAAVVDGFGDEMGATGEVGDILREIGALAATMPARDDHSEIHIVLTVR
ncbi:MAG TPA: DUF3352 domain-containing protein [Candidatus Limnocylindria bacterium]|nr:DUF3352 domain-containing protein [Candidatus Limnocylindria bacterium]